MQARNPLQWLEMAGSPSPSTMWKQRGVAQLGSAGALGAQIATSSSPVFAGLLSDRITPASDGE